MGKSEQPFKHKHENKEDDDKKEYLDHRPVGLSIRFLEFCAVPLCRPIEAKVLERLILYAKAA